MKKTALIVAATVVIAAVLGLHQTPVAAGSTRHLDYPMYFAVLLGVCKRLCAAVLAALGFPPESIWTYATFVFTLTRDAIAQAAAALS